MPGIDFLLADTGIDPSVLDAKGDLIVAASDDDPQRLGVGTNGHVLIADSTQPLGVRWGAVSGTGIPPQTVNAKGDLIAGTADDTVDRLGVGANNTVLVADSTQATGLRWANELTLASDSGERSLQVTSTGAVSTSESAGGAVTVTTTGSTGGGIYVYSNQAAPASGARLLSVLAANATFNQTMAWFEHRGTGTAVRIEHDGTISSNTVNALAVVGASTFDATTLGVSGYQDDLGTIKVSHFKPAGADTNAAALSILLDNPQTSGSSAAQGIFIDTSNTGVGSSAHTSTAKLLNLRSAGTEKFVLTAAGALTHTRTDSGDVAILQNTGATRTSLALNATAAQQALVEFREAGTPLWQVGKQTTDQFIIFNNAQGTNTLSAPSTADELNLVPNAGMVRIGSASAPTALLTLTAASINDQVVVDQDHGAQQNYDASLFAGARWDIEHGSAAAPYTGTQPTFKISTYRDSTTDASHSGTHPSMWAGMEIVSLGDSSTQAQPTALSGFARTSSTTATSFPIDNPDATAIIGIGFITGSGVGAGLGGYFESSLNSSSHPSGQPHGQSVECQIRNQATDATYSASGIGNSGALFLTTSGPKKAHAALQIGRSGGADFLVGIFFANGAQGDAVQDASYIDEGNAAISLHVKGSHTGGAIKIDNTTGGFIDMVELSGDPGSPGAGRARIYVKSSGGVSRVFSQDSGGVRGPL